MIYQEDYQKYKRFFTFGCSFTDYKYPTWANIMQRNMPHVEFYNLGRCGGGNTFISNRVTEANRVFKFCETDLIMIMWSTFCREDRYTYNHGWKLPGNIYSQNEYSFTTEEYIKEWGQPLTYLVRDLSTIDITTSFLNSLPCDNLCMMSVPLDHQQDLRCQKTRYILDLYSDLHYSYPDNMYELELGGSWVNGSRYKTSWTDDYNDYHPSPLRYANYLKKLNIHITDEAYQYAVDSTNKLSMITDDLEFPDVFPYADFKNTPTSML